MGKKKFSGCPTLDKLAGLYFRWCPNCGAGKDYLIQKDGDMRCLECGFEWDPFDYYYDRNTKSYVRKDDSDDDCNDDDDDDDCGDDDCSDDDDDDDCYDDDCYDDDDDDDCSDDDDDDDCGDDDCSDDDCRSKKMKHCPYCDSTNIRYAGDGAWWGDNIIYKYKCIDCGRVFPVPTEDVND